MLTKKFLSAVFTTTMLVMPFTIATTNAADILESTLRTDATVTRELAPDTATIRFYVENSGINLADLKAKNDKTVNAAITAIKKQLKEGETVKTIAFSVNNVYSYKDKVRVFQKYEVKNGFEVKIKDLSKVSNIIKTAMDNGVKNIGQLNFSLAEGESACTSAMADSIKIARKRAASLAEATGVQISKVKSVEPYCSLNNSYQPRYYANSMKMMSAGASDEPATMETIEAGTITVRANVNMTYYLK